MKSMNVHMPSVLVTDWMRGVHELPVHGAGQTLWGKEEGRRKKRKSGREKDEGEGEREKEKGRRRKKERGRGKKGESNQLPLKMRRPKMSYHVLEAVVHSEGLGVLMVVVTKFVSEISTLPEST